MRPASSRPWLQREGPSREEGGGVWTQFRGCRRLVLQKGKEVFSVGRSSPFHDPVMSTGPVLYTVRIMSGPTSSSCCGLNGFIWRGGGAGCQQQLWRQRVNMQVFFFCFRGQIQSPACAGQDVNNCPASSAFFFKLCISRGSHKLPKLALNLQPSCFRHLSAGITGLNHQARLPFLCHFYCLTRSLRPGLTGGKTTLGVFHV